MSIKKIELNAILDTDKIVGKHANQAEGTGMFNLVKEIDGN